MNYKKYENNRPCKDLYTFFVPLIPQHYNLTLFISS